MKIILIPIVSFSAFFGMVTLMLWFNNWGATAPSDLQQLIWAVNIVLWPFLLGLCTKILLSR